MAVVDLFLLLLVCIAFIFLNNVRVIISTGLLLLQSPGFPDLGYRMALRFLSRYIRYELITTSLINSLLIREPPVNFISYYHENIIDASRHFGVTSAVILHKVNTITSVKSLYKKAFLRFDCIKYMQIIHLYFAQLLYNVTAFA